MLIHSCPWLAINYSPLAASLTPRHPTDQVTYLHRQQHQRQPSRLTQYLLAVEVSYWFSPHAPTNDQCINENERHCWRMSIWQYFSSQIVCSRHNQLLATQPTPPSSFPLCLSLYSEMKSSCSMIRDFIKDNIFIVILTSSWLNVLDEKISSLIGPITRASANRSQGIFVWKKTLVGGSQIYYYNIL